MPIEFYQTVMGHRFFDSQLPRLIKALERIADALEKQQQPERLDMKDLPHQSAYTRLVAETGEHAANALRIIESMKPCVIWIEEWERQAIKDGMKNELP